MGLLKYHEILGNMHICDWNLYIIWFYLFYNSCLKCQEPFSQAGENVIEALFCI